MVTRSAKQTHVHQGYAAGWRLDQRHGQREGVNHPQQSELKLLEKTTFLLPRRQQPEQQHLLRCDEVQLQEPHEHLQATFPEHPQALKRHVYHTEPLQSEKKTQRKPGVGSLKTLVKIRVAKQG